MVKATRLSICLILFAALECAAQAPTQTRLSIDRAKTACVDIEDYAVAIQDDECSIVDFDLLTEMDGYAYYYARYQITAEVAFWPSLRDTLPEANALILFVGRAGEDFVQAYRTYHEDLAEFVVFAFPAPEMIETPRGKVLHIIRRGLGGGMQQWFNDEYWLWQWNEWQQLDVSSWYSKINSYLPSTYAMDGVSPAHFDLVNLRAISPVRKPQDAQCCPSAGTVTVSFDWVDLALTIRDVRHEPDVDFWTLVE
jgi:hypothetical protein